MLFFSLFKHREIDAREQPLKFLSRELHSLIFNARIFKTVVFVTSIKKPEAIVRKVNHLDLVSAFVSEDEKLPRTGVHF